MELQLADEEFAYLSDYLTRLERLSEQIRQLYAQGDDLSHIINTEWRAAYRRVKLEDTKYLEHDIPDIIDVSGQLMVTLDPKSKRAIWGEQLNVPMPRIEHRTEVIDDEEK